MAKLSKYIDHELLDSIQKFIAARGMSETAFGRSVANDSMLVSDIREGRELRRKTRQKVEAAITSEAKTP